MIQTSSRSAHAETARGTRLRDSIWFIVVVALVLRVLVISVGGTYRIRLAGDHFQFGWEVGRIARAIATGEGFSNPTDLATGPTAWAPPVYPYILAGVFKVFGVYTRLSAWVILTINSIFSALTCWTIYRIGERGFNRTTALWAAWTWALFPYAIYWPVRIVWETSLSALLLSIIILLTMRVSDEHRRTNWYLLGLCWGGAALINPALLSFAPFSSLWLAWRIGLRRAMAGVATIVAVSCVMLAPWIVRNYQVFGKFIFIRDNFGLELQVANNSNSQGGYWTRSEHPANNEAEMQEFARMGELAYMRNKTREAIEFIRSNKTTFAGWVAKRAYFFWGGKPQPTRVGSWNLLPARQTAFAISAALPFAGLILLFRRRRETAWLFAALLFIYPIPYYLAHPAPRYRHAIEPAMMLLAIYLFFVVREYRVTREGWRVRVDAR